MRRQDPSGRVAGSARWTPLRSAAVLCMALATMILSASGAAAAVLTVTDDLVTHFDAAVGTYTDNGTTPAADGQLVQWWDDQATAISGNNAAQQANTKPTLQTNVLNGLPVLHYSGGQNLLVLDGGAGGSSSPVGTALDTDTISWFAVVSKSSPVSTDRILGAQVGTAGDRWGSFYANGRYYGHSRTSGGSMIASWSPTPTDTFVTLGTVWDGGDPNNTVEQWINGVSSGVVTGADQPAGTFNRFRIGSSSGGGTGLTGDVAEVLVYNAALSTPDRRTVEDYLHTKYFTSGPPRVNDYPLADNLRLHATADARDISGSTVRDTAGIPQDGTIQGTVGNPAGTIGEALSFSGSDSNYVSFGDTLDPGADSYTVSLWFNPDDVSGTEFLASKGNPGSTSVGWSVFLSGDDLIVRGQQVGGTNAQRFGQTLFDNVTAGQWQHVVVVLDRDADTIRGYLNGSNAGWDSDWLVDDLVSGSSIANSDPLLLGRRSTNGVPFSGLIDDFAIWDRALSVDDIGYLYMKGLQGFNAATIPEPATWLLLGLGSIGLLSGCRRRRRGI